MKLNRSYLSVLLVFLALTGCNKSNNNNTNSNGSLSATIAGASFTANVVAGAYLTSTDQIFVIGYNIQNKDTSGIQVELPYLPPINHRFSTDSIPAELTYTAGGKEYYAYFGLANTDAQAVFTVTAVDTVGHHIVGTFSGLLFNTANASDSITISNGQFSSSYSLQ